MWKSANPSGRVRCVALGAVAALATSVLAGIPRASAAPGDLDPGFGGPAHGKVVLDLGTVTDLAVQAHGKIVLVGYERSGSGFNAVVARLKADGRVDNRFGTVELPAAPQGADQTAVPEAVAVQSDGRIVVAGHVTDGAGHEDFAVWRLMPSGAPDLAFGSSGDGLVQFGGDVTDDSAADVAFDAEGRIVVAGTSASATGPDLGVLRLTPKGGFDPTFNSGLTFFIPTHPGLDFATSVAIQPADGDILIGGFYSGESGNAVVRVIPGDSTPTGAAALDDSFGDHGAAAVPGAKPTNGGDVAVTAGGHILFLDQVPVTGGAAASVVRLSSAGGVDRTFGSPDGTGAHLTTAARATAAEALTLLPHGDMAVVGSDDTGRSFVAKLRSTGTPDLRMGPGGVETLPRGDLVAVAARRDGRIVTAGNIADDLSVVYRLRGDLKLPSCGGQKATIVGTKAADKLVGTKHADVITGLGGRDTITGLGRGDIICGGAGRDHLSGGAGADHLYGGRGRDTLRGGPGHDVLHQ